MTAMTKIRVKHSCHCWRSFDVDIDENEVPFHYHG